MLHTVYTCQGIYQSNLIFFCFHRKFLTTPRSSKPAKLKEENPSGILCFGVDVAERLNTDADESRASRDFNDQRDAECEARIVVIGTVKEPNC